MCSKTFRIQKVVRIFLIKNTKITSLPATPYSPKGGDLIPPGLRRTPLKGRIKSTYAKDWNKKSDKKNGGRTRRIL